MAKNTLSNETGQDLPKVYKMTQLITFSVVCNNFELRAETSVCLQAAMTREW